LLILATEFCIPGKMGLLSQIDMAIGGSAAARRICGEMAAGRAFQTLPDRKLAAYGCSLLPKCWWA